MTIFQKIIDGEIPAHKIYEDDKVLAFLDIHPILPGHTLVIPKNTVEFVWDLPDEDYIVLMNTSKKIALHLRQTMMKPYVSMKVIGVDVPHAHVHLIPFTDSADLHRPDHMDQEPDHEALAKMAEKLKLI